MATGATAKRLNLPREEEFWSRGISACAICDGASPIFKGQVLAVVGGGDTATEKAIYLTKYAGHVHLLVRRDQLRASKAMQDRSVFLSYFYSSLIQCIFPFQICYLYNRLIMANVTELLIIQILRCTTTQRRLML